MLLLYSASFGQSNGDYRSTSSATSFTSPIGWQTYSSATSQWTTAITAPAFAGTTQGSGGGLGPITHANSTLNGGANNLSISGAFTVAGTFTAATGTVNYSNLIGGQTI